jgi:hypothetical protein
MADSTVGHESMPPDRSTIAGILADLEPIGDLARFVIHEMDQDEEDRFFEILEDA